MEDLRLTRETIEAYGAYLRREDRASATREKYLADVTRFAAWLAEREATKELLAAWRDALLDRGLSPSTVNTKLIAVNGLLRFLGREDCRVKLLKIQRRVFRETSREMSREEYGRLVAAARDGGRPRLALLMEAICSTGIRVSEVKNITVESARAGQAVVRLKGKVRTILLPEKLCRKLLRYAGEQRIASGEIFLTRDGNSLSRKQIWREMKSLCERAGVEPSKVFPHNLRHLFATEFYRSCRDIVKLADVLGHSCVETTRIYLRTSGREHCKYLEMLRLVC